MRSVPIAWARYSVEGRQDSADGARLFEFYSNPSPPEAKGPTILIGCPGAGRWAEARPKTITIPGQGPMQPPSGCQGAIAIDSPVYGRRLFLVIGGYQLAEIREIQDIPADYHPERGYYAVPDVRKEAFTLEPDERIESDARMATDGRRVLICGRRHPYLWDCEDGRFHAIQAPTPDDQSADLPDEEFVDCAWIDGFFVLAARSGQLFHSLHSSRQFDQLDFASAEAFPDPIVGLASFNRRLFVFGTQSVEQWYHATGTGAGFVFRRDLSQVHQVGAACRAAIVSNQVGIWFLATDGIVYWIEATGRLRMSTEAVEYDIKRSYMNLSSAWAYTEEGRYFYALDLAFPDGSRKTWVLDIQARWWHEREHRGIGRAISFQGRNLALFKNSATVAYLDLDLGSWLGAYMDREVITPLLHSAENAVSMGNFQVDVAKRREFPESETIALSWSDDSKATWKGGRSKRIRQERIRWNGLGRFRNRNMRIRIRSRERIVINAAYAAYRPLGS